MKVGDLVKDNHPSRGMGPERIGVIIAETIRFSRGYNRQYRVLWRNGNIGNNVMDYDLKTLNEGR